MLDRLGNDNRYRITLEHCLVDGHTIVLDITAGLRADLDVWIGLLGRLLACHRAYDTR